MKGNLSFGFILLVLSTLACRPVIAIGGNELLFLFLLIVALLGPPSYRFLRKIEKYRKQKDQ